MHKLISNPIFRIIGIGIILYYGLLYNKNHPDSLGNRLAPEKVKSDLNEISSKSVNILANIKKAEDIKKSLNQSTKEQKPALEPKNAQ
ncbi:MAG: hypothetical protein V4612_03280 [Pseudomonadota bacterium]